MGVLLAKDGCGARLAKTIEVSSLHNDWYFSLAISTYQNDSESIRPSLRCRGRTSAVSNFKTAMHDIRTWNIRMAVVSWIPAVAQIQIQIQRWGRAAGLEPYARIIPPL
jgi:hypothetical protein